LTLLEILIALLLTGILATACFKFFTHVSHQAGVQLDISEMQTLCRASMEDIRKTVRSAGYMIEGPAYEIQGCSLLVFYSVTQPVDTTSYFLTEFTDEEYQRVPGLDGNLQVYKLMKQVNSEDPSVYADFITDMSFRQLSPSSILISITTQVPREDYTYANNEGFRTYTLTERVHVRNAN
jgi:hypothetical protein